MVIPTGYGAHLLRSDRSAVAVFLVLLTYPTEATTRLREVEMESVNNCLDITSFGVSKPEI